MEKISIIHPSTCCFLKVLAYEFQFLYLSLNERVLRIQETFDCLVDPDIVRRNFPKIYDILNNIGKRHPATKNRIISTCSSLEYNKLSDFEKRQHTASNCQGCLKK